jgi:hypothetical protein
MNYPNFTDPQFLDANAPGGLNQAFGTVSGAFALMGSGVWAAPGLLAPDSMTLSFAGMTATVGLPLPWSLVWSGGAVVNAHGSQTGIDTQSYSVSFASLVPASGSLTAYLAAFVNSIQQNPFPIPGPPPGHPAYDPAFVPVVGYATNVYSVSLTAVTGGIDNVNTFELFRTTLTAGQTNISAVNTVGQVRATQQLAKAQIRVSTGGLLTASQAYYVISPTVSGLTHTLPPASGAGGLIYTLVNPTAVWTIAATGTDRIAGSGVANGLASLTVPVSGAMQLWANAASGTWNIIGASPVPAVNLLPLNNTWTGNNTFNNSVAVSGATSANHAVNLGQFVSEWTGTNDGYETLPDNTIDLTYFAVAPYNGTGFLTTNITLPDGLFPNQILDASVCFNGNTPPLNVAISVQPSTRVSVNVTTNSSGGVGGNAGITLRMRGN